MLSFVKNKSPKATAEPLVRISNGVKGVTLVELIAVILILGLAVSALMGLLTQVTKTAYLDEDIAKASFCAQMGMERVKSEKTFANIANKTLVSCYSGLVYNITVNNATLSGSTWVITGTNNTYELVNVTGIRQRNSTEISPVAVSMYSLIGNCSGQVCF